MEDEVPGGAAAKRTILCYGDSNTWGSVPGLVKRRFPIHTRWPGAMSKLLRADYRVLEEGLCGRTTVFDDPIEGAFGVDKNGFRLLGSVLASHAPLDLVIIMLGTNDLKYRFSAAPGDIADGVGALVERTRSSEFGPGFQKPPETLIVCPPAIWEVESAFGPAFKGGQEKSLALPAAFGKMTDKVGVPLLYAEDFIQSDPADGIHLSAESHGILAQELVRRVLERFGGDMGTRNTGRLPETRAMA